MGHPLQITTTYCLLLFCFLNIASSFNFDEEYQRSYNLAMVPQVDYENLSWISSPLHTGGMYFIHEIDFNVDIYQYRYDNAPIADPNDLSCEITLCQNALKTTLSCYDSPRKFIRPQMAKTPLDDHLNFHFRYSEVGTDVVAIRCTFQGFGTLYPDGLITYKYRLTHDSTEYTTKVRPWTTLKNPTSRRFLTHLDNYAFSTETGMRLHLFGLKNSGIDLNKVFVVLTPYGPFSSSQPYEITTVPSLPQTPTVLFNTEFQCPYIIGRTGPKFCYLLEFDLGYNSRRINEISFNIDHSAVSMVFKIGAYNKLSNWPRSTDETGAWMAGGGGETTSGTGANFPTIVAIDAYQRQPNLKNRATITINVPTASSIYPLYHDQLTNHLYLIIICRAGPDNPSVVTTTTNAIQTTIAGEIECDAVLSPALASLDERHITDNALAGFQFGVGSFDLQPPYPPATVQSFYFKLIENASPITMSIEPSHYGTISLFDSSNNIEYSVTRSILRVTVPGLWSQAEVTLHLPVGVYLEQITSNLELHSITGFGHFPWVKVNGVAQDKNVHLWLSAHRKVISQCQDNINPTNNNYSNLCNSYRINFNVNRDPQETVVVDATFDVEVYRITNVAFPSIITFDNNNNDDNTLFIPDIYYIDGNNDDGNGGVVDGTSLSRDGLNVQVGLERFQVGDLLYSSQPQPIGVYTYPNERKLIPSFIHPPIVQTASSYFETTTLNNRNHISFSLFSSSQYVQNPSQQSVWSSNDNGMITLLPQNTFLFDFTNCNDFITITHNEVIENEYFIVTNGQPRNILRLQPIIESIQMIESSTLPIFTGIVTSANHRKYGSCNVVTQILDSNNVITQTYQSPIVVNAHSFVLIENQSNNAMIYFDIIAHSYSESYPPLLIDEYSSEELPSVPYNIHNRDVIFISLIPTQNVPSSANVHIVLEYKALPTDDQWTKLKIINIEHGIDYIDEDEIRFTFPETFSTTNARFVISYTDTSTSTTSLQFISSSFIVHSRCIDDNTWSSTCGNGNNNSEEEDQDAGGRCEVDGLCYCNNGTIGTSCNGSSSSPSPFPPPQPCPFCIKSNSIGCIQSDNNNPGDNDICQCKDGWGGVNCQSPKKCVDLSVSNCHYPNGLLKHIRSDNSCTSECECNVNNYDSYWAGKRCDVCTLQCYNNGQLYRSCDRCGCQAGFSGKYCRCIAKQGTIAIQAYNLLLEQYQNALLNNATTPIVSHPHYISFLTGSNRIYTDIISYLHLHFGFTITTTANNNNNNNNNNKNDNPTIQLKINTIQDNTTSLGRYSTISITFIYGCNESNPGYTTTMLNNKWSELISIFSSSDVAQQYFIFDTSLNDPIQADSEPTDIPDTLPPDDDALDNTNNAHNLITTHIPTIWLILVIIACGFIVELIH